MRQLGLSAATLGLALAALPVRLARAGSTGEGNESAPGGTTAAPAVSSATDPSDEPAPAPATGEPDREMRARELSRQAEIELAAGNKQAALELMTQSYELSRRPWLLLNLAILSRELGLCASARDRYRQYLAQAPNGLHRKKAAQAIEQLDRECPEPAPVVSPPPIPPPPPPKPSSLGFSRIVGWAAIGGGVALEMGALAFALAAERAESDYEAYQGTNGRLEAIAADGKRYDTWAIGLGLGGLGLAAGGVLLLVFGSPSGDHTPPPVSLTVTPGRLRSSYTFRF